MNCPSCGRPTAEGQRFCMACGAEVSAAPSQLPRDASETGPVRARAQSLVPAPAPSGNELAPAAGQNAILIGRDASLAAAGGCRLDHPAVSGRHALIERRAGGWYVVDLNSRKGTFVNYSRVPPGPAGLPVTEADTIWIAPFAFHLRLSGRGGELQPAHMRIDAEGLRRTVKTGGREQTILDVREAPLAFLPGELIALVGASGCGKSTLMKAINGLAPAQEGRICIDRSAIIEGSNARPFAALHSIMGYVPQDDVMYRDLTVSEALRYVARLRLADVTPAEMDAAVDSALEMVGLGSHASKVVRHLSGGQRKRVSIAMELLARPRLMFLDEPTSGLDPGLDLEIMTLLAAWARGDAGSDPKTIVLVTHATENIELCDYIAFMETGGRLAYFGPPAEAKRFFFPECPPSEVTYAQIYRRVTREAPEGGWAEAYRASPFYARYVARRAGAALRAAPESQEERRLPGWAALRAGLGQTGILAARQARLLARNRLNLAFLALQAPLVALLLAAVSSPQALRPAGAIDSEKVLFILACAAVWLGIINATKAIVSEQDIYARERLYGLGAVSYVGAKMAVLGAAGIIQMGLLVLCLDRALLLPEAGILGSIQVEYFVTLALSMLAGIALGLLVSSLAGSLDLATTLMFLLLIVQVIFSGLLFAPAGLAEVPASLTISRWALQALGSSTDLNHLLVGTLPGYAWSAGYSASGLHLITRWAILFVYAAACFGLACWRQGKK